MSDATDPERISEVRSWVNQALRELASAKDGTTDWRSVADKLTMALRWCGKPSDHDKVVERLFVQFRQEGLTGESAQRLADIGAWVLATFLSPAGESELSPEEARAQKAEKVLAEALGVIRHALKQLPKNCGPATRAEAFLQRHQETPDAQ